MQEKVGKAERLVRKQILLSRKQSEKLRARAATTGRPESELLREALDDWLARQDEQADDWKAAWRQAAGIWRDRTDLDELFTSLRRSWDRDPEQPSRTPRRRK